MARQEAVKEALKPHILYFKVELKAKLFITNHLFPTFSVAYSVFFITFFFLIVNLVFTAVCEHFIKTTVYIYISGTQLCEIII